MEPYSLLSSLAEQEQPQINVQVSLSIIPFGYLETKERYRLQPPLGTENEQDSPADEYAFPRGTSLSHIVAVSQPLVIVTY